MQKPFTILLLVWIVPLTGIAQQKSKSKFPMPEAGTMFVNSYYATDSSGRLVPKDVVDPRIGDDTLYIIRSGVKLFGRSHCFVIAAKSHPDTIYMSYAANGDLYGRGGHDKVWSVIPFGLKPGKKLVQDLGLDSGSLLGQDYVVPHHRVTEVVRHDTASVGDNVYDCIELLVDDIRLYNNQNWEQGTRYWYSPELGYIVKQNQGWSGSYFLNQQLKVWQPPKKK